MNYKRTIISCFTGYIVQAIINNFVPLLFITLQKQYRIPLSQITLLITVNFGIQLFVDLVSVVLVDKVGYKRSIVTAHILSAAGLILLTFLPELMNPFEGILISVAIYAVGGGLIEVLISPIMESCPTENKEKAMSLLHSFYCWGQVAVVLFSTIFFRFAGVDNWKILSYMWAGIPIINGILFLGAPIAPLIAEEERGMSIREFLTNKVFWILTLMMMCAGASELSVSQWVSFFAEKGLGINKVAGDLAGTMIFAILMGSARFFYGKYGEKIQLNKFMSVSGLVCVSAYLMIIFIPAPAISLAGCVICGLSVGIMWPGTFSIASKSLRNGGTALFSLLALAGDLGCLGGPTLVGVVSGSVNSMKAGFLAALIFPVGILVALCVLNKKERRRKEC